MEGIVIMGDIANAFYASSGINPSEFSLIVRSLVFALTTIWGGWGIYGQYVLYKKNQVEIFDIPMRIFRILLICSMMLLTVYIA